jgi:hypothetical protein
VVTARGRAPQASQGGLHGRDAGLRGRARQQAGSGRAGAGPREGDFSGASDRFDQARDSYVGADTWLDGERATAPSPSEAKKRAKSKSAGSKDPKADSLP